MTIQLNLTTSCLQFCFHGIDKFNRLGIMTSLLEKQIETNAMKKLTVSLNLNKLCIVNGFIHFQEVQNFNRHIIDQWFFNREMNNPDGLNSLQKINTKLRHLNSKFLFLFLAGTFLDEYNFDVTIYAQTIYHHFYLGFCINYDVQS
ncbi:unnamed protein product [Schistosoma mattheei]|uniref:Uncharacterized protein n=1 Tax=Schistosoma mattheei TaxID=31246 RepID=A0A183NXF6_9TREM|nr:unnamed protein product [Schistosoma mattheei]